MNVTFEGMQTNISLISVWRRGGRGWGGSPIPRDRGGWGGEREELLHQNDGKHFKCSKLRIDTESTRKVPLD